MSVATVVGSDLFVAQSVATVVIAVEALVTSTWLKSIHGHNPDGAACRYLGRA